MSNKADILMHGQANVKCAWCKIPCGQLATKQTNEMWIMTFTCEKCGRKIYILYQKEPTDRPETF